MKNRSKNYLSPPPAVISRNPIPLAPYSAIFSGLTSEADAQEADREESGADVRGPAQVPSACFSSLPSLLDNCWLHLLTFSLQEETEFPKAFYVFSSGTY